MLILWHIFSDAIVVPRPERLVTKLKSNVEENTGPKVILIRQPRGPDGTKGFNQNESKNTEEGSDDQADPSLETSYISSILKLSTLMAPEDK